MSFKENLLLILVLLPLLAACEMSGVQLTRSVVFCEFENEEYQPGETVPASDGCNTCVCSATGEIGGCTEMDCAEIQQDPITGLANPAAVRCFVDGFKYETREDSEGGQFGVCIDANSKECDGWEYFRGECLLGESTQKFVAKISGEVGEGNATAEFSAEKFALEVFANLPLPEGEKFYEAWIIRVEPLDQISVGRLVPEGEEGSFAVRFETPENLSDYGRVSITLEPESETILEGVFERVQ